MTADGDENRPQSGAAHGAEPSSEHRTEPSAAPELYGLSAMFRSADELCAAARRVRAAGYERLDAYTPFPVEALNEIVGAPRGGVPYLVLLGAALGAACGYFLQWYSAVVDYPINVGGRPLDSWPAFMLVTFELAVLGGALAGFFGMLILNGLPRLHHPLFDVPHFDLATRDRFFLVVERTDPLFDAQRTRDLLESLGAADVAEIPA